MYSVMIVDDDQWALADIRATFAFDQYGFELIAECTYAEQALPLILRENPHLVITDICMDADSGLELIRKVREKQRDTLFIILSGHESFAYAKEAVELSVMRYMLKPIDKAEAKQAMQQATQQLLARNAKELEHDDLFSRILSHVEEHLHESISLNELAQTFYLSRGYIPELFRKRLGMSFVEYKEQLRLNRAKKLLRSTDMPIGDIAEEIGYDIGYFSRVFKRNFSITPQQYRASKLKEAAQAEHMRKEEP